MTWVIECGQLPSFRESADSFFESLYNWTQFVYKTDKQDCCLMCKQILWMILKKKVRKNMEFKISPHCNELFMFCFVFHFFSPCHRKFLSNWAASTKLCSNLSNVSQSKWTHLRNSTNCGNVKNMEKKRWEHCLRQTRLKNEWWLVRGNFAGKERRKEIVSAGERNVESWK